MSKEKIIYAKDCKCSDCKKPAVCYWPVMDPDITSYPFCRKCVTKRQYKLTIKLMELD